MNELKRIRKKHKITQEQLSVDLGYDVSYISRVENGIHSPSGEYFKTFMHYFSIYEGMKDYDSFVNSEIKKETERIKGKYYEAI